VPALLYLIALGNLVIGSSAFVISGLVDLIAADLGSSLTAAGQAVTAYALATALLVPLLLAWTGRWPRRRALLLALALFTAGNALSALATGLGQLYLGRALMGLGSMFTPIGAGIALSLVAPAQRGRALATVFIGMSLSYVVGVPLGTWIGRSQGWATAFAVMTAASALMWVLAAWRVPARVESPGTGLHGVAEVLRRPEVLALLATTLLYFTAVFTVFSYIAPVHTALLPEGRLGLPWTLTLFGLAGVAGTLTGGFATDRFGPRRTMQVLLAVLTAMMALLPLTRGAEPLLLVVLVAWGCSGFGLMTPQQTRLAQLAPAQAPLLLSLNTSMLYLAMALGAAIGGPAAGVVGFDRLGWVATPFAVAAWLLVMAGPRPLPAQALEIGAGAPRSPIDPKEEMP
jgi:MFS transporter, DHA1 family, inner membrane transport protein